MFGSCCFEVVDQLRHMYLQQCRNRFQFDNQAVYNHICDIGTQYKTILIIYPNWDLSLNIESCLLKTMLQAILINLFQLPCPKIHMQLISNLPYQITLLICLLLRHTTPLQPLRSLRLTRNQRPETRNLKPTPLRPMRSLRPKTKSPSSAIQLSSLSSHPDSPSNTTTFRHIQ